MKLTQLSRLTILLFSFLMGNPVFVSASAAGFDAPGDCSLQRSGREHSRSRAAAPFPAGSLPAIAEEAGRHLPASYYIESSVPGAPGDDEQFLSANPRQRVHYQFLPSGVKIRPGNAAHEDWVVGVSLTGYGFDDSIEKVTFIDFEAVTSTRINYRHSDAIDEWYINSPFGLEHGFTLHAPPAKCSSDSNVVLELSLEEGLIPKVEAGSRTVGFYTAKGESVMSYGGLKAWDTAGRDLPVKMVAAENLLRLHIDIAGAEFPVTVDPLFSTESGLVSSQPKLDGDFGRSLALDGPWLVTGALLEDSGPEPVLPEDPIPPQGGAAYVYQRQADGSYTEYQRLTAADAASIDHFGISVAISGDTIVIGASEQDVSGQTNAGAVYVFEFDSAGCSVDCWQQVEKLTAGIPSAQASFGSAVDIDNDFLIVGAKAGQTAYIFERTAGVWNPVAQLGSSTGQTNTAFGASVAVSGDYCAVGAPQGENFFAGAVYVFNRIPGPGWGLEDKITGQAVLELFGSSLDINGNTLAVGAPGSASITGAARIYTRDSGGQWDTNPVGGLQPLQSDNVTPDAAAGDAFGGAVSVSAGQASMDYIVVSSLNNDDNGSESGSVYIYQDMSGWQQVRKLLASDAAAQDRFGNSVEIYGEVAIVGAQDKVVSSVAAGKVYAYYDATDTDSDGLSDLVESQICMETGGSVCTDPDLPDTDGDGLSDAVELAYGGNAGSYNTGDLNPVNADSDTDGLTDAQEVNTYATDPLDSDSDNDGYSDAEEVAAGADPLDSASLPFPWEIFMPAILHGGNNHSSSP